MTVLGALPGGDGDADGDGDAAGAGEGDADWLGDGPGAGPWVSSGSALATTVDAAQPATNRLAAPTFTAAGIAPIAIEGTGAGNLIHITVKSREPLKSA
ncbi:hypothetical protein MSTO_06610 [Mycobacterium stomatepiae]|uniref:Uncharacterized protein n=1 Tax=Mycobacterium stomatepiae TaxID=470076 RepID=A0A7I7Q3A3_9MYCO|nr:hypothetical protein MSTO_06610 [Mycobacterium stomatepiae]